MARASVRVGDRLPSFALPDHEGRVVRSESLLGQGPVVVYFYPKDDTPGCTREACSFRDAYEDFVAAGATVVGISRDSVERHASFVARHQLPFILLSDADGKVRQRFGVPKSLGILDGRVSYVVDADGIVRHTFDSQLRFHEHVEQALDVVRGLSAAGEDVHPSR